MITLENIIDWIEENIHTQEDYDALPQETRDLHMQAIDAEMDEQIAWARACAELEAQEAEARERARLEAIWEAVDLGSSESPNGGW